MNKSANYFCFSLYFSASVIFYCIKKKKKGGGEGSNAEIEHVLELHIKILIVTVDRRVFE